MKKYSDMITALAVIALGYVVFHFLGVGCPIKFLTGISCAGCGMTRAYFSLLRGDVGGAFSYHPLFMLPPAVVLFIIFKKKISAKLYYGFLFTAIVLFLIIYMLRLFDGSDTVVVFEPENGVIFRLGRAFLDLLKRFWA